jgi:hypothetical protein
MNHNKDHYLYNTQSECCDQFFGWDYNSCMGSVPSSGSNPAPSKTSTSLRWYPDWEGTNAKCLDDGHEPAYMVSNREVWMYASLSECCKSNGCHTSLLILFMSC